MLGHRQGDNNQVLALAEELGMPFETRTLRYNLLRALEGDFLGPVIASIEKGARRHITPPWPDLLIAIGRRVVPVARYVRKKSGGRTKLVLIGHPRVDPRDFDLVITTPQYPVPRHPNVMLLTLAMSRMGRPPVVDPDEAEWLERLPRPHLLMAIGGSTKYHDIEPEIITDSARRLANRADLLGGTLIAIGSPRTASDLLDALRSALQGSRHVFVDGKRPRFPVLMNDADEIFVTADSVSMLSEAIYTGRPVGMVPVALNETGRKWLGDEHQPGKGGGTRRDLRKIWRELEREGYVGTVDDPKSRSAENAVRRAADAVRRLLAE